MELRVLQYFLAVTREQSILKAAESLNLSQPTLSRQIRDMEEELGKQLFVRGARRITLTEEGMILRKRAEEIMELVKKAEDEIALAEEPVAGDITVGAGETVGVRFLIRAAQSLMREYPQVHFSMISGDKITVLENLDRGLTDFGLVFGEFDKARYEFMPAPHVDRWGVLMRPDADLAQKEVVSPEDLQDKPLIISRQACQDNTLPTLLGREATEWNVVGCYNLLFNGALMVEEGIGYALCLDEIANTVGSGNLCFRPLEGQQGATMNLIWKKYQPFTKAADKFLERVREQPE